MAIRKTVRATPETVTAKVTTVTEESRNLNAKGCFPNQEQGKQPFRFTHF